MKAVFSIISDSTDPEIKSCVATWDSPYGRTVSLPFYAGKDALAANSLVQEAYLAGLTMGELKITGDIQNFVSQFMSKRLEIVREENARLRGLLLDIGDYAHQHSTGPTVVDELWVVREMAYSEC